MAKSLAKTQGIFLLLALVLMYVPLIFISGRHISALIIFIIAIMALLK